jgi:hypothetical protein
VKFFDFILVGYDIRFYREVIQYRSERVDR